MRKNVFVLVVVVVLVAIGAWRLWPRPAAHRAATPSPAAAGTQPAKGDPWQKPTEDNTKREVPAPANWILDRDPEGVITVEGQVLGPDGAPLPGATVALSSNPVRLTQSDESGGFRFEKIVGRTYQFFAKRDDLVGQVTVKLTSEPEPVVIRLAQGARVEVTVTDEDGAPLAGASVWSEDLSQASRDDTETHPRDLETAKDGKVTLRGVSPGWTSVSASKPGYAASARTLSVAAGTTLHTTTLTLRRGVVVRGEVRDERGVAIANAKIRSTRAGGWGGNNAGGAKAQHATSDAQGKFTFPGLPAGKYVLHADDGEHAPASSKQFTITTTPVEGVVIVMSAGAMIAGTVVDGQKAPVGYASVRLASAASGTGGATMQLRSATADAKGAFVIRGLTREKVQLRAESDAASSHPVDVDLETKATAREVTLVLDVTGTISGIVVDQTGKPIAEANVQAFVDIFKSSETRPRWDGGDSNALAMSAPAGTTSDGAGNFTLRGLPDGDFRVWANRPGAANTDNWGQNGITAKTGAKDLRVVLSAPGRIIGKLRREDGAAPRFALAQRGWTPATPVREGEIAIEDVEPGSHDVTFRSIEFAQVTKHDIEVKPGATVDIGTITVPKGRTLSGRVVDGKGQPIANAKVKLGLLLVSAAEEDATSVEDPEEAAGARTTSTDSNGGFRLPGVNSKLTRIVATHPERGASLAVEVPAGTTDIANLALTLHGYGSVAGVVTYKGKPLAQTGITAAIKGGAALMAQTNDAGEFTFDKVPEGRVQLTVMRMQMMKMHSHVSEATVVAGQKTQANIAIVPGQLSAQITIKPLAGAKVDAAQVFAIKGVVAVANGEELTKRALDGSLGESAMQFWLGGAAGLPTFADLDAGTYSICTIPITGSLTDSKLMSRIQENLALLKVYCKQINLAASPALQSFTHEVPSMAPLPAPKE